MNILHKKQTKAYKNENNNVAFQIIFFWKKREKRTYQLIRQLQQASCNRKI